MLGILMLFWSMAIWPFIFQVSIITGNDCILSGCITIKTIGVGKTINWKLVSTEKGLDFVLHFTRRRQAKDRSLGNMNRLSAKTKAILHSVPVLQRDLRKYLSNTFFSANVRLGLSDAAATALACASISAVLGCLPHVKGYVTPDFRSECFCLDIRCIAAIRLGRLFVSAVLGAGAFALQSVRQKVGGVVNG